MLSIYHFILLFGIGLHKCWQPLRGWAFAGHICVVQEDGERRQKASDHSGNPEATETEDAWKQSKWILLNPQLTVKIGPYLILLMSLISLLTCVCGQGCAYMYIFLYIRVCRPVCEWFCCPCLYSIMRMWLTELKAPSNWLTNVFIKTSFESVICDNYDYYWILFISYTKLMKKDCIHIAVVEGRESDKMPFATQGGVLDSVLCV